MTSVKNLQDFVSTILILAKFYLIQDEKRHYFLE